MVLTQRQTQVLHECTRGLSDKEIARVLKIAPTTVGNHKSAIVARLGLAEFRRRVFVNG